MFQYFYGQLGSKFKTKKLFLEDNCNKITAESDLLKDERRIIGD